MNEEAFTFNLFALAAIVGDTGVAVLAIAVTVVTGVVAPLTPAVDKTGAEVCFALPPLNGGMGWMYIGIFFTAVSDFDAVGPAGF